jgi:NitT/TauT family transport system substrate-binding protein
VIYAYSADGGKAEHEKIRQTHAPSPSPRDARRSLPLRSESADGSVFAWNFPLLGTYWSAADMLVQHVAKKGSLKGKKIATPQLGNTQDVQLRAYLADNGFKITQTGGDVFILPTANADQLALFQRGELDASWTPEPWTTRLELEVGAQILVDDRETNVTLLASSAAFVKDQPDLAKKLVAAHQELTQWIKDHPAEAKVLIKAELTELMKATPKDELIDKALSRIVITDEVSRASLDKMVISAQKAGFLKEIPVLDQLFPKL